METSDLIAVGALVVAAIALFLNYREARVRSDEIQLLRRQVEGQERALEGEERERQARERANVVATTGGVSGGSTYDEHEFFILNGGPAIARSIFVWPRDDESGTDVTEPYSVMPALIPGERKDIRLNVRREVSRRGGLTLWGRWIDDSGEREEALVAIKRHG